MPPAATPNETLQSPVARVHLKTAPPALSHSALLARRVSLGTPKDSLVPWPVGPGACLESTSSLDTYYDEQDKIDEVVEGVSIHHKVHDVDPALQRDDLGRLQRGRLFLGPLEFPAVSSRGPDPNSSLRMTTPSWDCVLALGLWELSQCPGYPTWKMAIQA